MKKALLLMLFSITFIFGANAQFTSGFIENSSGCNWMFSDITQDASNNIFALYNRDNDYKLVQWNGAGWTNVGSFSSTTFANNWTATGVVSLKIDSNGDFHAAVSLQKNGSCCSQERGIFYAHSADGTSWTLTKIETHSHSSGWKNIYDAQIMLEGDGTPHITLLYVEAFGSRIKKIRHYVKSGGSWTGETAIQHSGVSNEITQLDAAIDNNDKIHIAYQKETNGSGLDGGLYYATNATGSWVESELAHGNTNQDQGRGLDIEIDPTNNKVHIIHENWQFKVYHVHNSSGSFTSSQINNNVSGRTGNKSFYINSSGGKFLTYVSGSGNWWTWRNIKYAFLAPGQSSWNTGTVRNAGSADQGNYYTSFYSNTGRAIIFYDRYTGSSCGTNSPRQLHYSTSNTCCITNSGPTTVGTIPNVTELENGPNKVINLAGYFNDAEDGAAGLTYSVTSTDPAYFSTSIAGSSLTINFAASGTGGPATITVRGTDSGGLHTSQSFNVTVNGSSVSFAVSGTESFSEGNIGSATKTFTVTKSGTTYVANSVNFSIGGTATLNSDYNSIGGTSGANSTTGTINFTSGQTSKTITVNVLGDNDIEADETITVTLSAASTSTGNGTASISTASATKTIQNDDSCLSDAGVISTTTATSNFTPCPGTDLLDNVGASAVFTTTNSPVTALYEHGMLVANSSGTIVLQKTAAPFDFDFSGLMDGSYTVYSITYRVTNPESTLAAYLTQITGTGSNNDIQEIINDDDDASSGGAGNGSYCLDLDNKNSGGTAVVVALQDNTAPTANCKPVTAVLDGSGNATIAQDAANDNSSDNCGIASYATNMTAFDCSHVGANTVTLTVTDVNGNSSTCTSTVTVQDNTAPTANCKPVTAVLDGSGNATIAQDAANDNSSDNCSIATYATSMTAFDCSHVGSNTVTLTVTDVNGNTSTCTSTVTVQDNTAPTANCKPVTAVLDGSGNATIAQDAANDNSSDNCGIASYATSMTAFDCSHVGANTVTLTVTDVNGNSSTCTSTVTVQDNTAPTANCKPVTAVLDGSGNATIAQDAANDNSSDNCGIASYATNMTAFDCSHVGANTVTLTVTDVNGNSSTCTSTVTVQDNTAPTANCKPVTAVLDGSGNATIAQDAANDNSSDNCSIATYATNMTAFDCSHVGTNTVTLTVTDVNGNSSTCTSTVIVQDNTAPTANCKPVTAVLDGSGNATIAQDAANDNSSDNCSIASYATSMTAFDCSHVGANTVTLTVTDVNGNSSTCTSTVTVQDNTAPTANCKPVTAVLDGSGNATIAQDAANDNSSDNCGIASYATSMTAFDCSHVGANTVTLTVTDVNGNSSTCTSTVTVQDNTAPTANCKPVTAVLDGSGNATIAQDAANDNSSDNCSIATYATSMTAFDCSHVGSNTVTLTVTDVNGNSSTCTSTVTVQDNTAPTANCKPVTAVLDGSGSATIAQDAANDNSSDNCGIATYATNMTAFDCSHVGANTVTLTVTDVNGNSSTCTSTVTVVDNELPTAVCLNPTITFNGEDDINLTASQVWKSSASFDNCGTVSFVGVSPASINCSQLGSTVSAVVTVTDVNGNQQTCTSNITVEGLPCGFTTDTDGIGCNGGSDVSFDTGNQTFDVSSQGCFTTGFSADAWAFVGQEFCGDGEFVARIASVTGGGYAGIAFRETTDADAKKVALFSNTTNFIRREIRTTTGGYALPQRIFRANVTWLKLVRSGNSFTGFTSSNGVNWQFTFATTIPMNSCIVAGMATYSTNSATVMTATFDNVQFTGGGIIPFSAQNNDGPVSGLTAPLNKVNLYPNPVGDLINIGFEEYIEKAVEVEVLDLSGKLLQSQSFEEAGTVLQIDVKDLNLSKGMYLINIKTEDDFVTRRFIKG